MVDYVKLNTSSPLTRKSKKFDGSRYKEYLYGSIESLDMEWADKIVDYNPDLKVDTNGFTKYLDRNMSVSTDCGFDLNSNVDVDVDVFSPDYLNGLNSSLDYVQTQNSVEVDYENNDVNDKFKQTGNVSTNVKFQYNKNVNENVPQYQKFNFHNYDELQKKYQELSSEFDKFKEKHESYVKDAESFRSCKDRMNLPKQEFDLEVDPKDKLELLLDHIYTVLSDTFGTDNTLVFYLEKFANLYVSYQNKVQLELTSLRTKAEVVESLETLVGEKTNYDKVLQQKDKTIDSLVEEIKNSKQTHNSELNKLKEEFEKVNSELQMKVEEFEKARDNYKTENSILKESVNNLTSQYTKLLSEQQQILSQMPLITLQNSKSTNGDVVYLQNWPKPNVVFDVDGLVDYKTDFDLKSKFGSNFIRNTNTVVDNRVFDSGSNLGLNNQNRLVENDVFEKKNFVKNWPELVEKTTQSTVEPVINTKLQPGTLENTRFLESLVKELYKKNEEFMDTISKKDMVISNQQDYICRLKSSLKEWESDAVLWLDYVDQSSSVMNHVN